MNPKQQLMVFFFSAVTSCVNFLFPAKNPSCSLDSSNYWRELPSWISLSWIKAVSGVTLMSAGWRWCFNASPSLLCLEFPFRTPGLVSRETWHTWGSSCAGCRLGTACPRRTCAWWRWAGRRQGSGADLCRCIRQCPGLGGSLFCSLFTFPESISKILIKSLNTI